MNQLCSLRGHLNSITTIETRHNLIVSTDDHGWIIVWDFHTHKALYCWKGHDKTVLTTRILDDHHILTHSKDSEIRIWDLSPSQIGKLTSNLPDLTFNELTYLNDETSSLVAKFPLPKFDSIPVNSLNFCNIDYHEGLLITPSTIDSDNFDIYQVDPIDFNISRLIHNCSGFKHYKHHTGYIEEINGTKRDGFGIIMIAKFVNHERFFIGYESGHLLGFRLEFPSSQSNFTSTNTTQSRSIINKEPKISLVYYNEFHVPNPILSIEVLDSTQLLVGSTGKKITVHNIESTDILNDEVREINVKYKGIQSIQVINNLIVTGTWNGVIKIFDTKNDFMLVDKHEIKLPRLNTLTSNHHQNDQLIESSQKFSALRIQHYNSSINSNSKYKNIVLRKKSNKLLVLVGYNNGRLMVFEIDKRE
ncbi:Astra associated protein 1 Asa1 [Yamadazyma tenuis]|nr:Astra associated protein 1 Asa1 [Yamadazyma tenuis]